MRYQITVHSALTVILLLSASPYAQAKKHKRHKREQTVMSSDRTLEVKDGSNVVIRSHDVASVAITGSSAEGSKKSGLFIELKSAAAKRFKEYTKAHIGQTLSVYVNGNLVSSPEIKTEIDGGHLAIDAGLSEDEAEKIARKFGG